MRGLALVDARVHPMGGAGTPEDWEREEEAVLWVKGRLLLAGSSSAVRVEAARRNIPVLEAKGRLLIPGFVDAHMHFLHAGVKLTRPDLRGTKSLEEALDRTRVFLLAHPGHDAVIAEGWDESDWAAVARRPLRDDLDGLLQGVGQERPLILRRICGHVSTASSEALNLLRTHKDWAKWCDASTGEVLEQPSLYLNEVFPASPGLLDRAVAAASKQAHALGVSCVGDYSQAPYRAALQRAAAAGRLTVRVVSSIYVQQLDDEIGVGFRTGRPAIGPADAHRAPRPGMHDALNPGFQGGSRKEGGTSEWLRDGGLKVFLDGSLGAHTAALRDNYTDLCPAGTPCDHPHPKGTPIWNDEEVRHLFGKAHRAGIQIHAHAIGDGAIDQGLHAFEELGLGGVTPSAGWQSGSPQAKTDGLGPTWARSIGQNPMRHRFEHFEVHHDDQVADALRLGIVSSSQPNFVGEWSAAGGMYEKRLGERYRLNNRFRRLKEAGIPLAFGSDGMPFGPLEGMAGAVGHPVETERLAPLEATWHYTTGPARALRWDTVGWLGEGCHADVTLLDTPGEDLSTWKVAAAFTDGVLRFGGV